MCGTAQALPALQLSCGTFWTVVISLGTTSGYVMFHCSGRACNLFTACQVAQLPEKMGATNPVTGPDGYLDSIYMWAVACAQH
mgnify:CR=1 FL=1|jgi:hypothetical protein